MPHGDMCPMNLIVESEDTPKINGIIVWEAGAMVTGVSFCPRQAFASFSMNMPRIVSLGGMQQNSGFALLSKLELNFN
ncbi:hypothetical protein K469DRAFT_120106 [Zopfia rhizophila CBS 207.26]|uniref:Uncharacterized protein n=1 Tax=Zopfia rhizophila CBS 207.26 TaxID=1314779 RepID=A0A6A6EAS5_9PEZI|nr:hypothetical protein K469DRAFT_120106 [Zopfia rhizophila CBS 207.26]